MEGEGEGGRPDYRLLAVLVGVAAALRFFAFDTVGLDHFDEGGYAMSARAVAEGLFGTERYPLQHFLSPPVLFGLAGVAMQGLGVSDHVLIGVSACAGVATVALVFVAARRWFGTAAGFAAALLVALSDFQVLYARSGLTDVTFGLCFLLALWLFAEAERRDSFGLAVFAGLAVGLAWNTKYHGWLACGVASAALLLGQVHAPDARAFVRGVLRIGVASVVAIVLYVPWFVFVSGQEGGYARLVAEHAQFLQPFSAIPQTLSHVHSQLHLDGWIGRLAPAVAALALAAWSDRRPATARWAGALAVAILGVALGATFFVGLAALIATVALFRTTTPGGRMAIAFLAAFSVLTPLYRPYPRLALPWLLGASLLAGVTIARAVRGTRSLPDALAWRDPPRPVSLALAAVAIALLAGVAWLRPPSWTAHPYRAKDGYRIAAAALAESLPRDETVAIWGEPGVVFYLRASREDVWHIDGPEGLRRVAASGEPVFVVTSMYAHRGDGRARLAAWAGVDDVPLLETHPVRAVSDVRLLDDGPLESARRFLAGDVDAYDLRVYRVTVPEE